jgi:hypothetical protein
MEVMPNSISGDVERYMPGSYDHGADNPDHSGRKTLATAKTVVTNVEGTAAAVASA